MRSRSVAIYTFLTFAWLTCVTHADVYFLIDGNVIAGKTISRSKSPDIRVETLSGVVTFPKNEVDGKETTRDLRKTFREREKALDYGKARDIAGLAAWCREKGLYEEMFCLYDQLFLLDPDNLSLKSFINEMSGTIRFKEFDVKAQKSDKKGYLLLKKMARSGRAYQSIGENLLAELPEPLREKVFLKGVKSSDAKTRAYTLDIVSGDKSSGVNAPALLEEMVTLAICEKNEEVRDAAQKALLKFRQDAILIPFVTALKSKVKHYRLNALDALALFKDPRTASALIENLRPSSNGKQGLPRRVHGSLHVGKSTAVVKGAKTGVSSRAAISSPDIARIKGGASLDVNLLAVSKPVIKNGERLKIAKVLAIITGVDYGDDYLLWCQWWNNNKEKILSSKKP